MGKIIFEEKHSNDTGAHKSKEKRFFCFVSGSLKKDNSLQSGIPSEHYGLSNGL